MGEDSREQLSQALGRVVSGIYILTTGTGENATGMLASFIEQVGFEPPMIVVAVRQGRPILGRLRASGVFAVNICHKQNNDLISHFSKGFPLGQPAFKGLETTTAVTQTPVLSASLGYLDCEIRNEISAGDHVLFLGEVVAGKLLSDGEPMVRIRKNGFDY